VAIKKMREELRIPLAELRDVYVPLLLWLRGVRAARRGARALVGVCGPAGAGKTTLAAALCALGAGAGGADGDVADVSMDGYHLPNAELEYLHGVVARAFGLPVLATGFELGAGARG
jgi:pantothenate kinase